MSLRSPFTVIARPMLWLALTGTLVTACEDRQRDVLSTPLVIRTHRDDGQPMPGVSVRVNEAPLGESDALGEMHARLSGAEGALFRLEAACPAGYINPRELPPIVLGRFEAISQAQAGLEVAVECERRWRTVAVVVRTRAVKRTVLLARRRSRHGAESSSDLAPVAGLPVILRGAEVSRTDAGGFAHFSIEAPPKSTVEVILDTAAEALPDLQPQRPALALNVHEFDDVYLLDQTFTEEHFVRPPPIVEKHTIHVLGNGLEDAALLRLPRTKRRAAP